MYICFICVTDKILGLYTIILCVLPASVCFIIHFINTFTIMFRDELDGSLSWFSGHIYLYASLQATFMHGIYLWKWINYVMHSLIWSLFCMCCSIMQICLLVDAFISSVFAYAWLVSPFQMLSSVDFLAFTLNLI